MGTRNVTLVRLNGKIKVAQYCQWDGYPTGQGKDIAEFLQKGLDLPVFKKAVAKLKWASAKAVKDTWTECGADPKSDSVSFDIADIHSKRYPEFSRDTGAKILQLIQDGAVKAVKNDKDFMKDSLFCEWAYEIDLDKQVVRVFQGFQRTGKTETIKRPDGTTYTQEKYAPCKAVKVIKFKDFKPKAMKSLEKELHGSD